MSMFTEKNKKSIRFKFLSVMSVILFMGTLVLSAVIAINQRVVLKNFLISQGHSRASFIAKLSKDPLLVKDSIQLDTIVNDSNRDEDIIYTIIHDTRGNLLTSQYASINYRIPRIKVILSGLSKDTELKGIISAIKEKEPIIEISNQIMIDIKPAGKVTIGVSGYRISQQILKTILFVIALNLIVAFILGSVLFTVSRKIILDPVTELASTADRLAKGDLSTRVNIKTTGEVQMLVESFNAMAGDLEKTTVSKETMEKLIDSMPYGIILIGKDKKILGANNAALAMMNYESEADIAGMICNNTLCPAEKDKCPIIDLKQDLDRSEKELITKDGIHIPILKTVVTIEIDKKEVLLEAFIDITERKQAEDLIKKSLKEKETLLREIHHRVKNNMSVISSLLALQADQIQDDTLKRMFEESQKRVKSMALVHEKLYHTKDLSHIDFSDYINTIAGELISSYHRPGREIITNIKAEGIVLDIDSAIPCGLIINELITNALKYAFPEDANGELSICFTKSDKTFTLTIKDNGIGLPEGFNFKIREARTLGLQLVDALTRQLRGTMQLNSDGGTEVVISFKERGI